VIGEAGGPTSEGVIGWAYATTGGNTGVWGQTESPSGVGVYYSGGLTGSGAKNCVVKTSRGPALMYCQESPESWFEDFGEGYLINGHCHIELDPLFVETVTISESDPLKVFIELGGDCNGVYVKKGLTGFDVYELKGGTSSVPFDFRVVAKRKGFESKRLDICDVAYRDSFLYPEVRETIRRGDHQSAEEPYRAREDVKRHQQRRYQEDPEVLREARRERESLRDEQAEAANLTEDIR
jgi:hypothetical protein